MVVSSLFEAVVEYPTDPILGISTAYKADTHVPKVDLGVGAYRTEEGNPYLFPIVKKIQVFLAGTQRDKEYLPIDGLPELKQPTQHLIFGHDSIAAREKRIATVQTLSGTGALRIAADFVKSQVVQCQHVYLSRPTWSNHHSIFAASGFIVKEYAYWNAVTRGIDLEQMLCDLRSAPSYSLVVLHACAHNPTGVDLTTEQWEAALAVVKEKELIPLFDCAYQGYASGDLERDAYAIRLFEKAGLEMFVTQSFAKNMGLYGERIGMLHVVCISSKSVTPVLSHLKRTIRQMYSSPPAWGARIVHQILSDDGNRKAWEGELKTVAGRVQHVRTLLKDGLVTKGTPGNWDHITSQIGMFSYTGLTIEQTEALTKKWHIYLLKSGRISMAGLNASNISYTIEAIDDVVRHIK